MTGVILAGGQGRRLGRPKAQVVVGRQPLIQRIISVVRALFDELLIVADQAQGLKGLGAEVVADIIPGGGPLGGIYGGLCHASSPEVFCFACDMPFLEAELIRHMINNCSGLDVLIPQYDGQLHPLHAIYSQTCLEPIRRQLAKGELKIINFFPHVRVGYLPLEEIKWVNPMGYALFNVNTQQELSLARRIARRISHQ